MKKGQKKPYYGKRTKRQVIEAYFESSASMDELSEIHGVLGSNTVASWLKKYGNLGIPKYSNREVMSKPHSPIEEKNGRKKRFKLDVHLRIGELESDLETARQRMQFYRYAMDIINDLAKELTGIDLLKKNWTGIVQSVFEAGIMSINAACKLLGYARSTFFEVRKNGISKAEKDELVEEFVLEKVKEIRQEMGRCGGKKMYYLICKDPEKKLYKFGRKRFFEILKKHGLLVKRRKKRIVTTDSRLWRGQYPDLTLDLIPSRPEQVWVADITYFKTKDGFIYGHLITDGYSKKLVGFEVADNMKATTTLLALKYAVKNRMYHEELIHHSDRGFQYLSRVYTNYLKKQKIKISVTQGGEAYKNPVAERINGILKDEFEFGGVFENLEQARELIEKVAQIYNDKRPHWSNSLLTPNEMHQQRELKIKTWRRKKKS